MEQATSAQNNFADSLKENNATDLDGLQTIFEPDHAQAVNDVDTVDAVFTDGAHSEKEYLTLDEAADKYAVSKDSIRRWLREGRLKGEKTDGPRGPQWSIPNNQRLAPPQTQGVHTIETGSRQSVHTIDAQAVNSLEDEESDQQETLNFKNDKTVEAFLELSKMLADASGRAAYLESELRQTKERVLLLPDLEAKAHKAGLLEQEQNKLAVENEALKQRLLEAEATLSAVKQTWWGKLFGRFGK